MNIESIDRESEIALEQMALERKSPQSPWNGVRTVLVVLSARAMVFDIESLRQKILLAYPEAAVFFMTPLGIPVGLAAPKKVDLVIDFTGPRQRQKFFLARRLRKMARLAVGRDAGGSRKRLYDRVYSESTAPGMPEEVLQLERRVQKEVLKLAGVIFVSFGDVPSDQSRTIALELPPLRRF